MTAHAETVLTDLADALKDTFEAAMDGDVKVYEYEPRDLDELPALTVGGMEIDRVDPDESESEIGAVDYDITTTVQIYESCDDPKTAFRRIRRLIPAAVAAVDKNGSSPLRDLALDAKVVSSTVGFTDQSDTGRQLVIGTLQVQSLILVTET